ncbi:hypothetical protein NUW54_g9482 [Trametes sanguinea]|uniref:Uncharacterized protein n=1 Tax=Trametes sanguinea TaxID=158606 RepID=A0ACC1P8M1_9APHY|nr:hypothetical protein NUW54_g9482 [Trametes sanguinea]
MRRSKSGSYRRLQVAFVGDSDAELPSWSNSLSTGLPSLVPTDLLSVQATLYHPNSLRTRSTPVHSTYLPIMGNRREDVKIFFEYQRDEDGRLLRAPGGHHYLPTENARRAQVEKLRRFYAAYPPVLELSEDCYPKVPKQEPGPLRRFRGWAHTFDFLKLYATKNKLEVPLRSEELAERYGKTSFIYGEFKPAEAEDEELQRDLAAGLILPVREHLERIAGPGVILPYRFPFSGEDAEGSRAHTSGVAERVQKAMQECDPDIQLLWWYDLATLGVNLLPPGI